MFSFNIVVESLTYGHKDNQNNFDMCFVKLTVVYRLRFNESLS